MSGKSNLRKLDLGINEEKDIFLSSINKKIRNNRKKIEAIDELAKKDKSTLNQEQLSKIKSRAEVLENIKYHETIKDMYYAAFKTAKDEGRLPQPTEQQAPVAQTQAAETIQPAVQESREDREAETARITSEVLSKVLNLVHVAQFYRDQNREVSEAESIYELYAKIFTFSESDRFVKINDKISGSLNELQSYINGADQPALRNLSYSHLQQTVERLASSTSFRSHNAEVRVQQVRTTAEPSAIGSELRRGQEDKLDVPAEADQLVPNVGGNQDKHRSPEKVQPVGETGQKDWGQVEDEEEEEEEEEVEEEREPEEAEEKEAPRQPEEERKINPYEDFVEVKGRQKEKKEEKPTRGGYRGGQRGGYRGGERGPRKPRVEGEEGQQTEGQQGGYRGGRGGYRGGNRPRTEGEGQQEGQQEGENRNREGGYRGGRGGYRGGNRGGYRGGNRGGNFQRRNEEGARQEVRQEAPSS